MFSEVPKGFGETERPERSKEARRDFLERFSDKRILNLKILNMNIKILAQNIVNNPSDFTTEQIEKYFEDYAKLRLSDVRLSLLNKTKEIAFGSGSAQERMEEIKALLSNEA